MKKLITTCSLLLLTLHVSSASAFTYARVKIFPTTILTKAVNTNKNRNLTTTYPTPTKKISLVEYNLSPTEWSHYLEFTAHYKDVDASSPPTVSDTAPYKPKPSPSPHSIDLGMNGVPVLDQGLHGACVTFAITAALDAAIGKGDYISQLCTLQLGAYLVERGEAESSGWEGNDPGIVYDILFDYGYINKQNQSTYSCGGMSEYPAYELQGYLGTPMELSHFENLREKIGSDITWEYVLTPQQRFSPHYTPQKAHQVLNQVKKHLASKHGRLTMGTRIFPDFYGTGAVGLHQHVKPHLYNEPDTWVVSQNIAKQSSQPNANYFGHHLIIVGYDDNATAKDTSGKIHKGLLIIRNSWGKEAGDEGNFYMSYDYFMRFTHQVMLIKSNLANAQ